MWRKTDLHRHTSTDQVWAPITADDFVGNCVADGLDVAAITDHNRIDQVELIVAAAKESRLEIIRGIEVMSFS
jgi:predicted metal-dependent phosphoesterase TrpH